MKKAEQSLDPVDWEEARATGHRMVDDMIDYLAGIRARPVWQPVPQDIEAELDEAVPLDGMPLDAVYDRFRSHVLPYPTGNIHPRFFGWVMGNGTVDGMLADMLASGMNPHVGGYDQGAALVEHRVMAWLRDIMGFPADTGGLLVSGGTMANLTGLAVARNESAAQDVRNGGLAGGEPLRVYGSVETHSWLEKACDLLGLGRGAVRRVAAEADGRISLPALGEAVADDRARGNIPFCVTGNAGTVDGGVIDDLDALAAFCDEQELWFHVDGAFGALLALTDSLRGRISGIERADSLAFDLHKWGFLQYEIGAVLVRRGDLLRTTFRTDAAYLEPAGRGIQPGPLDFAGMGVQLSRGFRALKVWMGLKHHGTRKIGAIIEQNVRQAQHLVRRIDAEPRLASLGPAPLNIVCFRYLDQALADRELDDLNREIMLRIQESGSAVLSGTIRDGKFALRVAITNHRTHTADIDALIDAVIAHGREIRGESEAS